MSRPMLVELLGFPGAGKTTVVKAAPERLSPGAGARYVARGKVNSRRPYKGWDAERIRSLYAAHRRVIGWIADWLEASTDVTVVRLDGTAPPDDNGARLADALPSTPHGEQAGQ